MINKIIKLLKNIILIDALFNLIKSKLEIIIFNP